MLVLQGARCIPGQDAIAPCIWLSCQHLLLRDTVGEPAIRNAIFDVAQMLKQLAAPYAAGSGRLILKLSALS